MTAPDAQSSLGVLGLPAPVRDLARRQWDAIVVGAGHNGLTAAAYLARAGRAVLVLERRDRVGGACTLERPFPDERYLVSPCAYVVGLLDPVVIRELALERHGYRVFVADPNLWCPLPDGRAVSVYLDERRTAEELRAQGFAERDIRGLAAYENVFERLRRALRHGEGGDTWRRPAPRRAELERLLEDDRELIAVLFEEPIADTLARYMDDERLHHALFGQGVIGAFAGPRDPGTAQVKLMHHQGDLLGHGAVWGYVEGGMGRVSFAIANAALAAGATIATGLPVARIVPGEGVELASGDTIHAPTVISNADPKRTADLLCADVSGAYLERLRSWRTDSPVVKLNAGLRRLPRFTADRTGEAHRAMVSVTPGLDAAQAATAAARRGEPAIGFAELYFQTAYDPSVAPPGRHTMSVFAQYAPYELAAGDWESRREEIAALVLDAIAAYAPDVRECVEHMELLGPPDIERRVGLSGGHIFQGEALPDQMWEHRLEWRAPVPGLYLCGACTHPAGSVIGLNGRGAAQAALADMGTR